MSIWRCILTVDKSDRLNLYIIQAEIPILCVQCKYFRTIAFGVESAFSGAEDDSCVLEPFAAILKFV